MARYCGPTAARRSLTVIRFWIGRELNLPVKLSTIDKEDNEKSITAIFTNIDVNKGITGSDLNLPRETADYHTTLDPLPSGNGEKTKESSK